MNKPWEEAGAFALPSKMPSRPESPPTTKVPRVFSIWGTINYGVAAIASIAIVLCMGIFAWTPQWWAIMPAFLYVFISTGIICLGRIEANRDAKFFIHALRKRSEDNERAMRKMN